MPAAKDFCRDWRFCKSDVVGAAKPAFDDSGWSCVILPHTWNADDMAPGVPQETAYIGPAWYRKRFVLDELEEEGRVLLLFEAIANHSEIWVDGKLLGGRDDGFLPVRLDLTDALDDGEEHVVAVRADNRPRLGTVPPEVIDWERYGGIYRPVWVLHKGGAYFAHGGIRLSTPAVSAANAVVHVTTRIEEWTCRSQVLQLVHVVEDSAGNEIGRHAEEITTRYGESVTIESELPPISTPELWCPDTPNLYRIHSILKSGDSVLDCAANPLGFRWFYFDPDEGFFLNGQPLKLVGADIHQDYPGLGNACPARFHRRDMELMKEAGLNFMRGSHYPRNERVLDACDELGIMVMEEQPYWHGSIRELHGQQLIDNSRRLMRDLVRHHGNHPSIIAWNTINEIMLVLDQNEWHPDPGHRSAATQLSSNEWPFVRRVLSAMVEELHAADPARPVSVVVGGNWRLNEEAGVTKFGDIVAYNGGAMHAEVDGKPVYDYGKEKDPLRVSIMSEGVLNEDPPLRGDWQREMSAWEGYAHHWSRIYERPWFCGGAMWVFADYSAKGTYRNMAMMDYARLPYEGFFFFKSQWNPLLNAHICGHWDWADELSQHRRVVVFTNGDEAELFLNGTSLGRRSPEREKWSYLPHPPIEWSVPFAPGTLRVQARRCGGVVEDVRVTSGQPQALMMRVENTLLANGRDVAFATLSVVDSVGNRCYTAAPFVQLRGEGVSCRITGPAQIQVRGGIARFAIRSTGETGTFMVTATASGLQPAAAAVETG